MTDPWISCNGRLIKASEMRISPFDQGLTVGKGLFETLMWDKGVLYSMSLHYKRLVESAKKWNLTLVSQSNLVAMIVETIMANEWQKEMLRVRITLTAGENPNFRGISEAGLLLITVNPIQSQSLVVKAGVAPFIRNDKSALTGMKTVAYAENQLAVKWATERRLEEAIFFNTRGKLCEGASSNIFVKIKGKWMTPALNCGCLAGVTRGLVIQLFACLEIPLEEGIIGAEDLPQIEQAFLTSSLRGIQLLSSIDDQKLSLKKQGTIERLLEKLRQVRRQS